MGVKSAKKVSLKQKKPCLICKKDFVLRLHNRHGDLVKGPVKNKPNASTWQSKSLKYVSFYNAWVCNKCEKKLELETLFGSVLNDVIGKPPRKKATERKTNDKNTERRKFKNKI